MPKHDPGVTIDGELYIRAENNWEAFWYSGSQQRMDERYWPFEHWCGMRGRPSATYNNTICVRQSAAKKCELITGPHWWAIMKALEAQQKI